MFSNTSREIDKLGEISDSFEIGNKFDNGRAQLYVSAFYNKFQNFITVDIFQWISTDIILAIR
ncbi:TonB-dependent receptor [Vibrio parahaemolyticus]|uniref:TonB-dependent receptor n=1 Tax=Vibrio parahaemolyticus TaxID=670 RepID=UPI0035A34785